MDWQSVRVFLYKSRPWRRVRLPRRLSSQLEANGFGFCFAVFDRLPCMVVESNVLSNDLYVLSVGFSVSAGAAGAAHLAPCSQSAAHQAATILTFGDVEDAW